MYYDGNIQNRKSGTLVCLNLFLSYKVNGTCQTSFYSPKSDMHALTLHESEPGHHTQVQHSAINRNAILMLLNVALTKDWIQYLIEFSGTCYLPIDSKQ